MKSLRYSLAITAALAVVVFFLFLVRNDGTPSDNSLSATPHQPQLRIASEDNTTLHRQEAYIGTIERREARLQQMHQQLRDAQQQPGNLAATLQQLRQQCIPDDDCEALIQDMLSRYEDRDFANLVEQALARLPLYDSAMQETVLSTSLPPRERYHTIHQLREQTLGPDITEALFGQEKAWAEYQFRYGELMASGIDTLSPQQRLQALDQLRADTFGRYAEALEKIEGVDGRYERERDMLLTGITDSEQRQQITHQLRRKHYGDDTASLMQQRDAQTQHHQQQVENYRQALQSLKDELEPLKSTLPEADWLHLQEQRLTELRLQHFPH